MIRAINQYQCEPSTQAHTYLQKISQKKVPGTDGIRPERMVLRCEIHSNRTCQKSHSGLLNIRNNMKVTNKLK